MWISIKKEYPNEELVRVMDENTGFKAVAEVNWHLTDHTQSVENGLIPPMAIKPFLRIPNTHK